MDGNKTVPSQEEIIGRKKEHRSTVIAIVLLFIVASIFFIAGIVFSVIGI